MSGVIRFLDTVTLAPSFWVKTITDPKAVDREPEPYYKTKVVRRTPVNVLDRATGRILQIMPVTEKWNAAMEVFARHQMMVKQRKRAQALSRKRRSILACKRYNVL